MQIKFVLKNVSLGDDQKEYIESKVEKLSHLADRLADESTEFRVEVDHEESRMQEHAYQCIVTIFAPQETLRAEARSDTINNAVDDVVNKLKVQIEKYKAKIHHINERGNQA